MYRQPSTETGAVAGYYGRTQEPHSQRLIMGPHLTTTYSPTSLPIFSSSLRPVVWAQSCEWVRISASVQMCAGGSKKNSGCVGGDWTLAELSLGRLASV